MATRIVKIVLSQADCEALDRVQADKEAGAAHWSRSASVREAIRAHFLPFYEPFVKTSHQGPGSERS